jgi:hypothetical protein
VHVVGERALLPRTPTELHLDADRDELRRNFDRTSFVFSHRLAGHPLFALDRLLELAKKMAEDPRDVYFNAGDIRVDQRWDQVAACDLPVDEILRRIETAGAWIILRYAEKDPEYAALLDECIAEIEALLGRDLSKLIKLRNAIVFITSPDRISSYHMDHECNFLLQISGTKTISVFNRYDREVLPETEIERFWAADTNAAIYKPHFQDRAATFLLTPGQGVHIPVNSPHWVQNGPQVSVSLSVNFHYHDSILGDIYRANYWLRRLGLNPSPPHRSPIVDHAKRVAFSSARSLNHARRRLIGKT